MMVMMMMMMMVMVMMVVVVKVMVMVIGVMMLTMMVVVMMMMMEGSKRSKQVHTQTCVLSTGGLGHRGVAAAGVRLGAALVGSGQGGRRG
jgi:hypothetical protein